MVVVLCRGRSQAECLQAGTDSLVMSSGLDAGHGQAVPGLGIVRDGSQGQAKVSLGLQIVHPGQGLMACPGVGRRLEATPRRGGRGGPGLQAGPVSPELDVDEPGQFDHANPAHPVRHLCADRGVLLEGPIPREVPGIRSARQKHHDLRPELLQVGRQLALQAGAVLPVESQVEDLEPSSWLVGVELPLEVGGVGLFTRDSRTGGIRVPHAEDHAGRRGRAQGGLRQALGQPYGPQHDLQAQHGEGQTHAKDQNPLGKPPTQLQSTSPTIQVVQPQFDSAQCRPVWQCPMAAGQALS